MNKNIEYENEKRKIQKRNLTPDEYERAIRDICKRIKY